MHLFSLLRKRLLVSPVSGFPKEELIFLKKSQISLSLSLEEIALREREICDSERKKREERETRRTICARA